ncbi:hypothetical protein J7J64_19735 [Lysobacter sp. ISL-42]|nr:hypothetical protein [Lysobacter sp. ISL-42]MBT2751590.1 hypothetical protein [Lysobacter sp. ISL-50]MBT2775784.1 hypothetical protein [Lysobacter sp. ISL-54]MBT2782251.1 hypothetical protein [Lysobacter sp. ISL-52]
MLRVMRGCRTAAAHLRDVHRGRTPSSTSLPVGQWTTLGIPLKCLALAGANLSKSSGLLTIEISAPFNRRSRASR